MFRRSDADKRVDTLIVNTKISHVVCTTCLLTTFIRYALGQKIGKPLNLRVFGSKLNKEIILDSQHRLKKPNKTVSNIERIQCVYK
jgi:hypothetical protein